MFNRSKGSVNNLVATKEYAAVFVTSLTHKMHCRQALRWYLHQTLAVRFALVSELVTRPGKDQSQNSNTRKLNPSVFKLFVWKIRQKWLLTTSGDLSYGLQLCVRMYSTHPAFPDGGSWRELFCRGRDACKTCRFGQPDHCALLQFWGLVSSFHSGRDKCYRLY